MHEMNKTDQENEKMQKYKHREDKQQIKPGIIEQKYSEYDTFILIIICWTNTIIMFF